MRTGLGWGGAAVELPRHGVLCRSLTIVAKCGRKEVHLDDWDRRWERLHLINHNERPVVTARSTGRGQHRQGA